MQTSTNLGAEFWTNAGYLVLGTNEQGGGIDYDEVTNGTPATDPPSYIWLKLECQ